MTLKIGDRVHETSTTTGTGTYDLGGPETGAQSFVAAIGDGDSTIYVASDGVDWEIGFGVVTAGAPNTLSREYVLGSSNSGNAVDWANGTRDIISSPHGQAIVGDTIVTTTTVTCDLDDYGRTYILNSGSSISFTLPDVGTAGADNYLPIGWEITVIAKAGGAGGTIYANDTYGDSINGAASLALAAGDSVKLRHAGAGYFCIEHYYDAA